MKLEFSYLKKPSLGKFGICCLSLIIIYLGFSFIIDDFYDSFINLILQFLFWSIITLIICLAVPKKDYRKEYYNIINNGDKIRGEIIRCSVRTIRAHRTHFKYGEIHVSIDGRDKITWFDYIVYNKKFKEFKSKIEQNWDKKKNNIAYRGRFEITLYELNGELAADLDSIKFVEE